MEKRTWESEGAESKGGGEAGALCLSVPSLPPQPFIIWLLPTRLQNILYVK